jgi:hypothetical protein
MSEHSQILAKYRALMSASNALTKDANLAFLPHLDSKVKEWVGQKVASGNERALRFLPGDIVPQRVGVFAQHLSGNSVAPVSWAQHLVMQDANLRQEIPASEQFRTLAVVCHLKTSDKQYVVSRRSENVELYNGFWDGAAAGYVDLTAHFWDSLDLVPEVYRETNEEVNINSYEILSAELLGLCNHTAYMITDATFVVHTVLTAEQVLSRAEHAKDSWEGKHSAFTHDQLMAMLREGQPFKPPLAAAVLIGN